jgi:hypothetical protein
MDVRRLKTAEIKFMRCIVGYSLLDNPVENKLAQ